MQSHRKNILIYYTGYTKVYSVNPLYLIFKNANGYFEEINKNKYLTLVSTYDSKEKLENIKNCGVTSEI